MGWAKEMYSGLDNLHRTYKLHQTFFSLTLDDTSIEDYYARFRNVCQELDLAELVSTNISVMQKQHKSMPSGFDFLVLRRCPP